MTREVVYAGHRGAPQNMVIYTFDGIKYNSEDLQLININVNAQYMFDLTIASIYVYM